MEGIKEENHERPFSWLSITFVLLVLVLTEMKSNSLARTFVVVALLRNREEVRRNCSSSVMFGPKLRPPTFRLPSSVVKSLKSDHSGLWVLCAGGA